MNLTDLNFHRPANLQATLPPEQRNRARDEVRMLVSTAGGHRHARFLDLPDLLEPGDLLVVNRSATLAASLPAWGSPGSFIVNFSTSYGGDVWLVEPRWSPDRPGPLPLHGGEQIDVAGLNVRLLTRHPGLPRLWFVRVEGDVCRTMTESGRPIRYGYVERTQPLSAYQTIFSAVPGSAEMPSAARPFTPQVVAALREKGISIAGLLLHTGVSSMEVESEQIEDQVLYAEPFQVPRHTAGAVNRARRVIAVGTTVVRALESAWDGEKVQPRRGFTRAYVHPSTGVNTVDGLLTGFHDPRASHLAMLHAIAAPADARRARPDFIHSAYGEAVRQGYLWHEFGDSHLILLPRQAGGKEE